MNLKQKKSLAVRALNVGRARIVFLKSRLSDIKEAITKNDIKDLVGDGAIVITEIKGRKKVVKGSRGKSTGNIRKKLNTRKQDYVIMVRKQRRYVAEMKKQGILNLEEIKNIRNKIRNKTFKSKANLKKYIEGLKK